MRTPYGHTFSVTSRGQRWSGMWELIGKEVCVTSAFGSCRVPVGRRKPEAVASEALEDLVKAWVTR